MADTDVAGYDTTNPEEGNIGWLKAIILVQPIPVGFGNELNKPLR